jgi:hypothetical protein
MLYHGLRWSHVSPERRMHRHTVALFAVLFLGPAALAAPTFSDIVHRRFQAWDANGDGKLMPDEVDRLSVDAAWKGDDAAAIATIKLAMRSKKDAIASLSLADLEETSQRPLDQDQELALPAVEDAAAKKPDTLQSRYVRAARSIKSAKRDLFLDPTPDLDKLHQGRIGDCFFVSVVGAMVERNPQSVKTMIVSEGGEKGFKVSFGNGKTVTVPPLTDVEYALTSTTGDEGVWLPVLEKAYGAVRAERLPESKRPQSTTDAIARGGSSATSIQYLTGHKTESVKLAKGKATAPDTLLATLRTKLTAAAQEHRLMAAGTDAEPGTPGINGNHAYAILGFDDASGMVHLWNPHGNTFKPKGEPGKMNGYPTKGGRFDVPLAEFATIFRGVAIETEKPVDKS